MKKEILDEMIKVASALDALGLYKEASNVDRVAEVGYTPTTRGNTGSFEDHIKNYKAHVKARDITGATNYFNGYMMGNSSPAEKNFFRAQAERIRRIYGFGEFDGQFYTDNIDQAQVDNYLRKYMLLDPKINKAEFDKRWTKMMLEFMYLKNQSNKMNKDSKAWEEQMAVTYRMLTQRLPR